MIIVNNDKPWLAPVATDDNEQQAIIIGAGMAGAATARSLALRGWQVTVLDRATAPAMAASGNPQGMLYVRLSPNPTPLNQLLLAGYHTTIDLLAQAPSELYQLCGLIQLPGSDKERERQQKLVTNGHHLQNYPDMVHYHTAETLSELAGVNIEQNGLFYPRGGWLQPPLFVRWLLDHSNITFRGGYEVTALVHKNNHWRLSLIDKQQRSNKKELSSKVVIFANAHYANLFAQTAHLPLKGIRGQITSVPATTASTALTKVICGDGYIAPAHNGRHTLGATFHFDDYDDSVRMSDHQQNLENIAEFAPAMAKALNFDSFIDPQTTADSQPLGDSQIKAAQLIGKTGYRCTTPDYLPVVGPIMDNEEFGQRFAILATHAKTHVDASVPWLPGLYINTGHGSRGLITAPLAGELLASMICGAGMCTTAAELTEHMHPGRFPARALIRGTRGKTAKKS